MNFFAELLRLIGFFVILICSIVFLAQFNNYHGIISNIFAICSCIGVFACSFYFISKINDIFAFIRNIFNEFKIKLFDSIEPATTKTKALIENVTAFLVAVGALAIAIKTISETMFEVVGLFL